MKLNELFLTYKGLNISNDDNDILDSSQKEVLKLKLLEDNIRRLKERDIDYGDSLESNTFIVTPEIFKPEEEQEEIVEELPEIKVEESNKNSNETQRYNDEISRLPNLKPLQVRPEINYSNTTTNRVQSIQMGDNNNFLKFNEEYNKFLLMYPLYRNSRNILTSIAALESQYNIRASNPTSSALGYFLLIKDTRNAYSNVSDEEFVKNPYELFKVASMYYNDIVKQLKPYYKYIKSTRLTPLLLIYGYWWRPKSMINLLKNGEDNYVSNDNMTIQDILYRAQ